MSQDQFDKKIRDLFGSLGKEDLSESQSRKEDIWNSLVLKPKKKKNSVLFWFVILGILLAGIAWLLYMDSAASNQKVELQVNHNHNHVQNFQDSLSTLRKVYKTQDQKLDSLILANQTLRAELKALKGHKHLPLDPKETIVYIRDTVKVPEYKIKKQIVELVKIDTIFIELAPEYDLESTTSIDAEADGEAKKSEGSKKKYPSSIQYNFSQDKSKINNQ